MIKEKQQYIDKHTDKTLYNTKYTYMHSLVCLVVCSFARLLVHSIRQCNESPLQMKSINWYCLVITIQFSFVWKIKSHIDVNLLFIFNQLEILSNRKQETVSFKNNDHLTNKESYRQKCKKTTRTKWKQQSAPTKSQFNGQLKCFQWH